MQPVQKFNMPVDAASPQTRLSARGRLTATVLALAEQPETEVAVQLAQVRDALDEVLAMDCRFPFHLAAFVKEKFGRSKVAVALLVEAANRVGESRRRAGRAAVLPFAMRPLVHRVVITQGDAAYAMAWQVRHFGWAMPTPLRAALTDVLQRSSEPSSDGEDDPSHSRGPALRELQPVLASA